AGDTQLGGGLMTPAGKRRRPPPVTPPAPVRDLDGMLRRLHLPTVRRLYGELATRAETEGMSYRVYLETLMAEEIAHRAKTRLTAALTPYLHPHVLIIDELGYLSHAADAANVLYRVINERYLQRRPILLTTNKPLAALGDVMHDGDLAEAILDRLLERGAHFALRGRSYRTRHLPEAEQPTRRKSA